MALDISSLYDHVSSFSQTQKSEVISLSFAEVDFQVDIAKECKSNQKKRLKQVLASSLDAYH